MQVVQVHHHFFFPAPKYKYIFWNKKWFLKILENPRGLHQHYLDNFGAYEYKATETGLE